MSISTNSVIPSLPQSFIQAIAPTGKLRAAINLGNPILANLDKTTQQAYGVSVDLATAFAKQLGVDVELQVYDTAAKSVEAVTLEHADIGFFAIDPLRGAGIAFTAAYVLIEGSYMVRADSKLQSNDEVDQTEHRVTVGKGSAYDLFLSRELKRAQIVRAPSSQTVVDLFVEQGLDVAAGVKQQLEMDMLRISKEMPNVKLRLLPGNFMVIQQAMGLPKSRGGSAAQALSQFVEAMKARDFVQAAMQRHGIKGASVAPAASK
jgi:polar amino acid transport system substrate-binding protein